MKEIMIDFLSWFKKDSVPLFDKFCAGFLTVVITCWLIFLLIAILISVFYQPWVMVIITVAAFAIFSIIYLITKYD